MSLKKKKCMVTYSKRYLPGGFHVFDLMQHIKVMIYHTWVPYTFNAPSAWSAQLKLSYSESLLDRAANHAKLCEQLSDTDRCSQRMRQRPPNSLIYKFNRIWISGFGVKVYFLVLVVSFNCIFSRYICKQKISILLYCYHQTRGNILGPIQAFKLSILHDFARIQKTAFLTELWILFLKLSSTGKETWHWGLNIIILTGRKLRKIKYFKAKPETQEHKNWTAYEKKIP